MVTLFTFPILLLLMAVPVSGATARSQTTNQDDIRCCSPCTKDPHDPLTGEAPPDAMCKRDEVRCQCRCEAFNGEGQITVKKLVEYVEEICHENRPCRHPLEGPTKCCEQAQVPCNESKWEDPDPCGQNWVPSSQGAWSGCEPWYPMVLSGPWSEWP